jgi:hypothetical protein
MTKIIPFLILPLLLGLFMTLVVVLYGLVEWSKVVLKTAKNSTPSVPECKSL